MSQTTSALSKAANAEYKRKQKEAERAESRGSLVQALVALVVTLAFIVPVYLVIVNSLKPHAQIFTNPAAIPIPPTFQNFTDVLTRPDGLFWSGLLNSTQLTLVSTVLSILFAALMAHYMVRRKNRISKFLFILIPMGLMIPTVTTLMPLLTVLKELNLVGSVFGLMLVYIAGNLPFGVLVFTGFLRSIPMELEEAAEIDGAGPMRTFWQIVFPLMRPAAASVFIFTSVGIWNDFVTPLIVLGPGSGNTVTVGMYRQISEHVSNYGAVFAFMVLATIPIQKKYNDLQKHFVKGLLGGATKG